MSHLLRSRFLYINQWNTTVSLYLARVLFIHSLMQTNLGFKFGYQFCGFFYI